MASSDIRPLGAGDGTGFYWIRTGDGLGAGYLSLVAIDEVGTVTSLPIRGEFDAAAPTRAEAVEAHLANAIAEADRDLERRRRDAPEPAAKPPPVDPATRRFLEDD